MSPEIIPVATVEPSMAQLRTMRDAIDNPVEDKPTPAVKADPEPEAGEKPAETKQEPTEADDPLPEGVQKRIAKEVEKAAKYQRQIDEAVSNRKAKEKELADLSAPGPEPVKPTAAEKKAPEFGETGHESETYAQYQARDREFLKSEIAADTRKAMEQEFADRQRKTAGEAKRAEGVKAQIEAGTIKDAAEFTALMDKAQELAPDGLQLAISSLDNWHGVAVHLAKDPAKLEDLATMFKANPYAAVAKLGRIEASLKTASKSAAAELPNPPAKDGGGASASGGAFDINKANVAQIRREAVKLGLRKAG